MVRLKWRHAWLSHSHVYLIQKIAHVLKKSLATWTWVTCALAQYYQLIFSFSLFNSLLQWIKRICLPNSSAIDNLCNNIIVSHFCLHLSCSLKMTAQLFGSKVHCLCRPTNLTTSEKAPCEANRQKISLTELASNCKESKQVVENAPSEPALICTAFAIEVIWSFQERSDLRVTTQHGYFVTKFQWARIKGKSLSTRLKIRQHRFLSALRD